MGVDRLNDWKDRLMFADKAYDVEHMLNMYAEDYITIPAAAIYDDAALAPLMERIQTCHIYIVGFIPRIDFTGASQDGRNLICHLKVLGKIRDVSFPIPDGAQLKVTNVDGEDYWALVDANGDRSE